MLHTVLVSYAWSQSSWMLIGPDRFNPVSCCQSLLMRMVFEIKQTLISISEAVSSAALILNDKEWLIGCERRSKMEVVGENNT